MEILPLGIFISLIILSVISQPVCYTSCSQAGCLNNNALLCTKCDTGTFLINQRCAVSGSQSVNYIQFQQPISFLTPNQFGSLDISSIQSDYTNRKPISCSSKNDGQTAIVSYLNVTRTTIGSSYAFRFQRIFIQSPHQFINIKINAILFNKKFLPKISLLVIDGNDNTLYDQSVEGNDSEMNCVTSSVTRSTSKAFFIIIRLSTTTQNILLQIYTANTGDELGISNVLIFSGNCDESCSKCEGPASNQCLTCRNLLMYDKTTKRCVSCPISFYKVNEACYPCPFHCQTCILNTNIGIPQCTKCQQNLGNIALPGCILKNYVVQNFVGLIFQNSESWQSSSILTNLVTVCGRYSLLGGVPSGLGGSNLFKQFIDLPVHNQVWIKFTLFLIDQVSGSQYKTNILVDGVNILSVNVTIDSQIMSTSQCGTDRIQFIKTIILPNITHNKSELTFSITGVNNYFGIRDFALIVFNLTNQTNCDQVNAANNCVRCKRGYAVNAPPPNSTTNAAPSICSACPNGYYQNMGFCQICPVHCKTCIFSNTVQCTSCDLPLQFDQILGMCYDVNNNLYTALLTQNWTQTFRDWDMVPKLPNLGISQCNNNTILGSNQLLYRQLNMKKTFSGLPSHKGVSLQFYLYQIDDFDLSDSPNQFHTISFKLGSTVIPYSGSKIGYNMCGNSTYDSVKKIIINDPNHQDSTLTLEVTGNRTKFGLSNMMVYLSNCEECKKVQITYSIESIPLYSVDTQSLTEDRGLLTKAVFSANIQVKADLKKLMYVKLQDPNALVGQSNQTRTTGEKDPFENIFAELQANRQLNLIQKLMKDEYNKSVYSIISAPEMIYGFTSSITGSSITRSVSLNLVNSTFSRYDNLHLDTDGSQKRANIRNLMNLFRGISILAMFIGLLSFLIGLSELFDDLFTLCQVIFVHIFIQSAWSSASFKLPLSAMSSVQFMAWLPTQAMKSIESGIIPFNIYQPSPLVYQQYWTDINFARAIYHTIIFLVIMIVLFWFIRLIKALREPSIKNIMEISRQKSYFVQNFYYSYIKNWFVYIDRVVRFTFFTVMWSACLQFINFVVEPSSFMKWNSTLCIVFFVGYIGYVIGGFFYLRDQASFTQDSTFKQKFDGLRIKKGSLWYFIIKYVKLLAIAFLIGQLYKFNPLATLIPLMTIHLAQTIVLIIKNPLIQDAGEFEMIVSSCTKQYWKFYRISLIIQNILFFILQLIMIIMYGIRTTANKSSFISTGFWCCAVIVLMLFLGLIRLGWGFVRYFEIVNQGIKAKEQEIKSEEEIDPLKFLDLYRNNVNNEATPSALRPGPRRPSIQMGV